MTESAILEATAQHRWSPIEGLPDDWRGLSDPQTALTVSIWHEQEGELRARGSLDNFLQKLKRQWAVETGAIEDLYRISEGATKTLIERGLDAALISHEDVDDTPIAVVSKIRDQLDAVDGLYQFVSSERPLTKSYLRELHQVITRHQQRYQARDTLGTLVTRALPRGQWKKLPNNVEGSDGEVVFEFCPPEQVESEIDRLLGMYEEHVELHVPPDVEAAWLHHRFTLIHPFTDGNGRIARCLATLVLVKGRWLPLVITRKDKLEYISALRSADRGDLRPLVRLFGTLQRKAIREVLSIGEDVLREANQLSGVLESVRAKFEKKNAELGELIRRAHETADTLHEIAKGRLDDAAREIEPVLQVANPEFSVYASAAPQSDEKAHYNYHQIIQCAKKLGYFANLDAYRSWVALTLRTDLRTDILLSFHPLGHGHTGVMVCSAMIYAKRTDDEGNTVFDEIVPLTDEPFVFTFGEEPMNVQRRFTSWLEDVIPKALARWAAGLE